MVKKLVKCTEEYWEFVRELRNNPKVQDGFLEKINITKEQQSKYMSVNADSYRVCLYNNEPAGYVGVIENDIRICTEPKYQGLQVGQFMLEQCKGIWPFATAKVLHSNQASLKLFTRCGYKKCNHDSKFIYFKNLDKMPNLKSTVTEKGKYVSQILHFIGGEKRTFNRVDTESIKQGQFTKFETEDGRLVMVNDKNVLCIEIIKEDN
jgi:hypothetical protein